MHSVTCQAPAKINLFLAITGKRPDGYHELKTEMVKLRLADRITLTPGGEGICLRCPGTDLPTDQSNLAYKAAMAFYARADVAGGVGIVLEKNIPTAAGLGGGSSDAASVLLGLNEMYGYPLSSEALIDISRPLGADVPFFVAACDAAWATGIGDQLTCNMPAVPQWIVLVNPGFAVSTKWVYDNFALTTKGNPYILGRDFVPGSGSTAMQEEFPLYNDLEQVTIGRYPELAAIKEGLLADGAQGALMSGSGPTVFGLYDDENNARVSFARFRDRYGDNVFLTGPRSTHVTC